MVNRLKDRLGENKIDPKATKRNQRVKHPERTCIACRKKAHPSVFLRVSNDPANGPVIVENGSSPGRSVYFCRTQACIESGLAKNKLARSLKTQLTAEQTEGIKKELICKLQK